MNAKYSSRKASNYSDIVSIAEDSTGHWEVTREQHIRMLKKTSLNNADDSVLNRSSARNPGNRDRTQSSDATQSNIKSRLSKLSKLMRVKGNISSAVQSQPVDQNRPPFRLLDDDDVQNSPRRTRQRNRISDSPSVSSSQVLGDNGSVNSSVALESIANFTEASLDTVKASNITEKDFTPTDGKNGSNKKKSVVKQWNKFKRFMGVKTAPEESLKSLESHSPFAAHSQNRNRADTDDTRSSNSGTKSWKRSRSDGSSSAGSSNITGRSNPPLSYANLTSKTMNIMDDNIRRRLDGMDMMFLGGASLALAANNLTNDVLPSLPTPLHSFDGTLMDRSNAEIVSDMLLSTGGCDPPEIILDGICPGPDGRWTVRMEQAIYSERDRFERRNPQNSSPKPGSVSPNVGCGWMQGRNLLNTSPNSSIYCVPPLQGSFASSDGNENESSVTDDILFIPTHILQRRLWGPESGPIDLTNLDEEEPINITNDLKTGNMDNNSLHSGLDDPLLSLAAKCSIPIDIDEDTFIISSRDHIHSIQEIASASLAKGRFQVALRVLQSLLKGLNTMSQTDYSQQTDKEEYDLRFSKGATMHNIGILQLWLGQYSEALTSFENAVIERERLLPKNHSDICVSLTRQASASFALGKLDLAKDAFEKALEMVPPGHIAQAKIFNNLGVVYYQQGNFTESLKEFTKSLDMQRAWLDAPVRRQCTIFDATITLSNMGKLYLQRADHDLSLYLYEESLLLQTSIFRKDHHMVLATLKSLALTKMRAGDVENGILILQGCLRSQSAKFGKNSPETTETVGLCGFLHAKINQYEESLQCFLQVRKWQKGNLPSGHPALKESKELIKTVETVACSRDMTHKSSSGTSPKVWV